MRTLCDVNRVEVEGSNVDIKVRTLVEDTGWVDSSIGVIMVVDGAIVVIKDDEKNLDDDENRVLPLNKMYM